MTILNKKFDIKKREKDIYNKLMQKKRRRALVNRKVL